MVLFPAGGVELQCSVIAGTHGGGIWKWNINNGSVIMMLCVDNHEGNGAHVPKGGDLWEEGESLGNPRGTPNDERLLPNKHYYIKPEFIIAASGIRNFTCFSFQTKAFYRVILVGKCIIPNQRKLYT